VKPLALLAVSRLRALLPPSTPIIGCGGISSGSDALEFAQAGASAVQLYTSFGFRGVGLPALIKDEVAEELGRRGGVSWMDVVQKGKEKREVKEVVGLEERRKVGGVEGLQELVDEAEKALSR
jgi:dihydroorotate dehydrogenase